MSARNAVLGKVGSNLKLKCCYNVVLVRMLYATVPDRHRVFVAEENCWYIHESYEANLKQLLEKLNFVVSYEGQEKPADQNEFAILGLLPTARFEVCEAAYKALCKINHPDTGGDPEMMKQINVAWLKIKVAKANSKTM